MWIEIFRIGTQTDSSGRPANYTPETLDKIAEIYNTRIKESKSFEAPLVKGHPSSNKPAYGWVERLARRGNLLLAKIKDITPEIREEVRNGMFKKLSMAIYPDMMLRHVGLLGAASPAVKGLRNVEFEEEKNSVESESYSEYIFKITYTDNPEANKTIEEPNPNPAENIEPVYTFSDNEEKQQLKRKIEELHDLNKTYEEKFVILEKEHRNRQYREFANSLMKNADGMLITPAQSDLLVDLMEMGFIADRKNNESGQFSEVSDYVEKLKRFVLTFKPAFTFNELTNPEIISNNIKESKFSDKNVNRERMALHEKAKHLQMIYPGMTYEDAVCKMMSENF